MHMQMLCCAMLRYAYDALCYGDANAVLCRCKSCILLCYTCAYAYVVLCMCICMCCAVHVHMHMSCYAYATALVVLCYAYVIIVLCCAVLCTCSMHMLCRAVQCRISGIHFRSRMQCPAVRRSTASEARLPGRPAPHTTGERARRSVVPSGNCERAGCPPPFNAGGGRAAARTHGR